MESKITATIEQQETNLEHLLYIFKGSTDSRHLRHHADAIMQLIIYGEIALSTPLLQPQFYVRAERILHEARNLQLDLLSFHSPTDCPHCNNHFTFNNTNI
jgi:hypothetical protein